MMKRFVSSLSLLTLSVFAYADIEISKSGILKSTACGYGRGKIAIVDAKSRASAELANFIQGTKTLAKNSDTQQLTTSISENAENLYQQQRNVMIEGMQAQSLLLDYSTPQLSGNDTCISVSLDLKKIEQQKQTKWQQETQDISVTVAGQGWPKKGTTALVNAEQDALQRAISQVVGVWLTQQSSQSSSSHMEIIDGVEAVTMRDVISQQLLSHSEGLVKEWKTLSIKELDNSGREVTILAVVEKKPLIQQTSKLLSMIGSPRVQVLAPEPLKAELKLWLNEQGIEVGSSASIVINAESRLLDRGNNKQLNLNVDVRDLAGNIYERWKNDPSLISLPNNEYVKRDLLDINLASEPQSKALRASLSSAFTKIVERGGLVREILLPNDKLSRPELLHDLLSTLGGVSDVSIHTRNNYTVANLRYKGNTGELAHAIDMAIATIASEVLSKIEIENDFTLRYK